jgi:hypothetical protein
VRVGGRLASAPWRHTTGVGHSPEAAGSVGEREMTAYSSAWRSPQSPCSPHSHSRPLPRIKGRLTGAAATRPTPVRLTTPPTAGMAAQAGGWGVGSVCTAPRTSATGRSGFAFDTAAECISANGRR